MVDVSVPLNPKFIGCYAEDGYTHDAECVIYHGPDSEHRGKEICFCYNMDTLTLVDVTIHMKPLMISRTSYTGCRFSHQVSTHA